MKALDLGIWVALIELSQSERGIFSVEDDIVTRQKRTTLGDTSMYRRSNLSDNGPADGSLLPFLSLHNHFSFVVVHHQKSAIIVSETCMPTVYRDKSSSYNDTDHKYWSKVLVTDSYFS